MAASGNVFETFTARKPNRELEGLSMKVMCAWCRKDLSGPDPEEAPVATSHGICADCAAVFRSQGGVPLQRFIDSIPVPILLLDSASRVTLANEQACETLGKQSPAIVDEVFGTVYECAHARHPEGCGQAIHCSGCTIRRTVLETLATGIPQVSVPATLSVEDGQTSRIAFTITTWKVDGAVLMRLDSAK